MKILFVTHIGETLGHLVRGLAIADELYRMGVESEVAASESASWLLQNWTKRYKHHVITWSWSHNAVDPNRPDVAYISRVLQSNRELGALLTSMRPDVVVGVPGVFTTQTARALRIPHVSVLHGPYLSPIVCLPHPTAIETAIINFARHIACGGSFDRILSHLARELGLPALTYEQYLASEPIFVPQPGLELPPLPNLHRGNFIRASFGPPFEDAEVELDEACFVTFGSGNPCDLTQIVDVARSAFRWVIVSNPTGLPHPSRDGVVVKPVVASSSLAGRVAAVISHGGIGTVGTFAERQTRQLIIPTEIDQATMAVHARRLGIARHCGLEMWASALRLGRRLPTFDNEELSSAIHGLRLDVPSATAGVSSGASDIAAALVHHRALA